jgi:hypothetical protein
MPISDNGGWTIDDSLFICPLSSVLRRPYPACFAEGDERATELGISFRPLLSVRRFPIPFFAGLVVVAGSQYPIPSRTRPLNSPAPMVLSLKTWKSRSLPGLRRTDISSSRQHCLKIYLGSIRHPSVMPLQSTLADFDLILMETYRVALGSSWSRRRSRACSTSAVLDFPVI